MLKVDYNNNNSLYFQRDRVKITRFIGNNRIWYSVGAENKNNKIIINMFTIYIPRKIMDKERFQKNNLKNSDNYQEKISMSKMGF